AALKIKEKYDAKITVISMGPPKAEDALREALAMGADEGILFSDRKLAGSDTLATSYALSCAIRKIGCYNLILCGMEATDGNTGQVGPGVAERLGIPQLTYIEDFEIKGNYIEAKRMLEGGYERVRVKHPALLTITNTANEPRNTTFAGIIKATKQSLTTWSASDIKVDESKIGLSGSPTKIKKIEKAVSQRRKYIVEGETIDEVLDNLLKKLEEEGINLGDGNGKKI
ncbi:MAG: electron transfer flavoprotein subunit beta/FixA family protein, partial [bacterium]